MKKMWHSRMNWFKASIMCAFINCITASTLQRCPEKNVFLDFNILMYVGEWNEILRIPNVLEEGYSCMLDEFTLTPEGVITMHSHAYNASNGAYVILDGIASASEPGRFEITYSGETVWSSSYWVLGTDYNRYVVLWGCLIEPSGTIRPLSWIASRQKTLDETAMREVEVILSQNGLSLDNYEEVMQSNCPALYITTPA